MHIINRFVAIIKPKQPLLDWLESIGRMTRIAIIAFTASLVLCASHVCAKETDQPSYPELGITTTSLIIHPSIGYWFGKIGTRFTGMYLNKDHHEFHFNIGYRLHDTDRTQHSINLLTSWIAGSDPGADYKYGATGYNIPQKLDRVLR